VPFTRSCLNNKRIRKELGQHTEDTAISSLTLLKMMVSTLGFLMQQFQRQFMLTGQIPMPSRWRSCSEMEGPLPHMDNGTSVNLVSGMPD
jgi:hypothetical protein